MAAKRLNVVRNRACMGHDHSMDVAAADVNANLLLIDNADDYQNDGYK